MDKTNAERFHLTTKNLYKNIINILTKNKKYLTAPVSNS